MPQPIEARPNTIKPNWNIRFEPNRSLIPPAESINTAKDAFKIARAIGSQRTIARVTDLCTLLDNSPYRKESSVAQLKAVLATS